MEQVTFKNNKNTLYIVSTPIGNLEDITYRAVNILKEVTHILAEDTRVTGVLLKKYNIDTKMISLHEHNEFEKTDLVVNLLNEGDIALVSDAGTPLVNDPGSILVKEVIKQGFNVSSIPGASAFLAGLVASGISSETFTYLGFLPRKDSKQKEFLNNYKLSNETLIVYESPNRINKTLKNLMEVFSNRSVTIGRELTKIFETYTRTTLLEASKMEWITRGEYVIIIEGNNEEIDENLSISELVAYYLDLGYDEKEAMRNTAKRLGISRRDVYEEFKVNKTWFYYNKTL